MRTLGAVLAGGQASRFGGDKALAEWRGRALIDHVIDTLDAEVAAIVLCGRSHRGLPALADRPGAGLGPLAALNAALHYAAGHGFDRVLALPCDVPTIAPGVLRRLLEQEGPTYLQEAPVIGVWPAALAPRLDTHLAAAGGRSLRGWGVAVGAVALALDADQLPVNVNRRGDLDRLALDPG